MIPAQNTFRQNCTRCLRPTSYCYCALIQKFNSRIQFVILIHPIEAKRKIATGRMAHLCLANSLLIKGSNFTSNELVNNIIQDTNNHCLLLYPGTNAIDISTPLHAHENHALLPQDKKTVIFVVDGTWSTAKKTVARSENLKCLQAICFTPKSPSQFRIRKQPAANCYSTIEAIHHIIDVVSNPSDAVTATRPHDVLLTVFKNMVAQQVVFCPV